MCEWWIYQGEGEGEEGEEGEMNGKNHIKINFLSIIDEI
jgi:hypothetical protein